MFTAQSPNISSVVAKAAFLLSVDDDGGDDVVLNCDNSKFNISSQLLYCR